MDLRNVDFKKIQSLTPDEIIIAGVLAKAAKEAEEAKKIIYDTYVFKMGENEKVVWQNGHDNYEMVTHDGRWKGHYNRNGEYTINCRKESKDIYSFFYAQILLEEGYVTADDIASGETTYAEMRAISAYFRAFVDRCKKGKDKMEKKTKTDDLVTKAQSEPKESEKESEELEEELVEEVMTEEELDNEEELDDGLGM